MAITITPIKAHVIGDRRLVVQDILLDNSYPTGGYALSPKQLGCDLELDAVFSNHGIGGNTYPYDFTAKKLMAFAGGSQVANTTDLSALTVRVTALGKGSSVQAP